MMVVTATETCCNTDWLCQMFFAVSNKQDQQLEERWFSLQGEFPDDGGYSHRNML